MQFEEKLLNELRTAQQALVQGMMNLPAEDLKKHYLQVGQHQGLEKAVEILTDLMGESEDE